MKLKFKTQDFQTAAVAAIVDLFKGQEKRQDTFTITNETAVQFDEFNLGYSNTLSLTDERITANMNAVQKRFSLPITNDDTRQFCIEMETGTGKTYVYTKTIFELHKQFGFTKFIVVVPSVAIREGVYKSFQITSEHFAAQYDNTPVRCFIYDSKKLANIRLFATFTDIEIMIINIDAFKKSENVINQAQDRLSGDSAMKYIADTNPIVIIDEPQSVDNTPKAKEAIASLNPLVVLRYSATHREKINLLYRLTPVDAYQMGLVKQICVSSNQIDGDFNRPYIRIISVSNANGFSAKIEIDKASKSGKVERKIVTIKQGADIHQLSGERDLYAGYAVAGIDCTPGNEGIEFTNGEFLRLGKAIGYIDETVIKRAQIRRTIEKHLEKELTLTERGIKVLSLFFIDEVAKYRTIEGAEPAATSKGIYALMFEECYAELLALPKFEKLRGRFTTDVSKVHNGYFSQDKKGNFKDTRGDTNDDYDTYNTIMKDKEWLLSFDCPLRFIFSHSALKEGWLSFHLWIQRIPLSNRGIHFYVIVKIKHKGIHFRLKNEYPCFFALKRLKTSINCIPQHVQLFHHMPRTCREGLYRENCPRFHNLQSLYFHISRRKHLTPVYPATLCQFYSIFPVPKVRLFQEPPSNNCVFCFLLFFQLQRGQAFSG